MGADIYLRSKSEACRARWEPVFMAAVAARDAIPAESRGGDLQKAVEEAYEKMYAEGYYRDAYNASAVLWVLGLSWWRDVGDMLTEDSTLPIAQAKRLKRMLLEAPLTLSVARAYCREHEMQEPEQWLERWEKDRKDLIDLLDQSIALGEPLYCSI